MWHAEASSSGTSTVDVCLQFLPRLKDLAARHNPDAHDLEVAYRGVEDGKVRCSTVPPPLPFSLGKMREVHVPGESRVIAVHLLAMGSRKPSCACLALPRKREERAQVSNVSPAVSGHEPAA